MLLQEDIERETRIACVREQMQLVRRMHFTPKETQVAWRLMEALLRPISLPASDSLLEELDRLPYEMARAQDERDIAKQQPKIVLDANYGTQTNVNGFDKPVLSNFLNNNTKQAISVTG